MKTARRFTSHNTWADFFIAALAWLASAGAVHADGGVVRARQIAGPYTVTVFSAPTPLRVGLVDISVFVQDTDSSAAVLDAVVDVILEAAGQPARVLQGSATHARATNKLLYAAEFHLPAAGRWRGTVTIRAGGNAHAVPFELDTAPALPPALASWPYLAAPFVALAVYALNQWLARGAARGDISSRPRSPDWHKAGEESMSSLFL